MKKISVVVFLCLLFAFASESKAVKLGSIFTRAYVSKGGSYNTGFTVWDQPHRILIRVLGPSVRDAFGHVANDPKVKVYDLNLNLLASNDNWVDNVSKQEIEQTGLAPEFDQEAALIMTINPGLYSIEVSSADEGNVLLEMYDLGELRSLYDDFNTTSLDTQKWTVLAGNPVIVDDNYLHCNSSYRDPVSGRYVCMIKSTNQSHGWGAAVQVASNNPHGPLGIRRCAGKKDSLLICGELFVETNSDVYARIVQLSGETDLFGTVLFSEKILHLSDGIFLSVAFSADFNTFSFIAAPQGTETIMTLNKYVDIATEKLEAAPLLIYSYSSSTTPLSSTFLINYVEY